MRRYTGQKPYRIRKAKLSRQTCVHTLLSCLVGKEELNKKPFPASNSFKEKTVTHRPLG